MSREVIQQLLQNYQPKNRAERERALREILQELTLVGLWRAKFFEHAAFYGGTALRILYGLDRFSEDLDFTLKSPLNDFDWKPYSQFVVDELRSFGFEARMESKVKKHSTPIASAFLKTNTFESLIKIGAREASLIGLHPEASIRIKVEVDTAPTPGLSYETVMLDDPLPIPISAVVKPDLFAGKLHAALYRAWRNRVKGRDWWDVIWFIRKKTPLNLNYFSHCMQEGKMLDPGEILNTDQLKEIAIGRIKELDIKAAQADVRPFLRDPSLVDLWSEEFLISWIEKL